MIALARRFRTITYSRYLAASIFALALDLGLFMLLREAELPILAVSALSYAAGIAAHWLMSSRLVFGMAAGTLRSTLVAAVLVRAVGAGWPVAHGRGRRHRQPADRPVAGQAARRRH